MRIRFVLALAVVAAGCGKKAPEAVPTPTNEPTNTTPTTGTPNTGTRPTTPPDNRAELERADLLRILQEPIYFEYDQDALRSDAQATLERKAAILLANAGLRIRIAGHADERGSDEYNLVLGTRRATTAKRFFEAKGIDASRIEVVSFGEERPADPSSSDAAWAKNRRDEFEILSGADRLVKPQ
ncbi:MAG: OmpA family protein [Gemmatimonadales bacterium]|nr:OmpA family protein [Gemmatimonadales bacterium]